MQDRTIGLGDDTPLAGATRRAGRRAPIRHGGRSVETSGPARAERGGLAVERATPPEIGPPMGWTGETGTPATEEAPTGPTGERAAASAPGRSRPDRPAPDPADRRGRPGTVRVWRSNRDAAPVQVRATAQGRSADDRVPEGLPDLERALVNPAAVFVTPAAVLDHPRLLPSCKREILRRWAWDEYLKEVAAAEGMADGEPSRLDAVTVALLALGETRRPHPAAPAAAIPGLRGRPQAA